MMQLQQKLWLTVFNTPLHLSREYTVFGPNAYTEAL